MMVGPDDREPTDCNCEDAEGVNPNPDGPHPNCPKCQGEGFYWPADDDSFDDDVI